MKTPDNTALGHDRDAPAGGHGLRNEKKLISVYLESINMKNQFLWLLAFVVIGITSQCTNTTCPCPDQPQQVPEGILGLIRETLLLHPPNTGDPAIREHTIMTLDEILKVESSRDSSNVFEFYSSMMQKVSDEIQDEVFDGIRIWMMYNHGFIIKTPQSTFAFDLIDGYSGWQIVRNYELPDNVVNRIDVLFISHEHKDHTDELLIQKIKDNGRLVINTVENEPILTNGLHVQTHLGLHSVENRIFEVTTANGYKIVHTGDNQTSEALPDIENTDVLLLNAWVNESGTTYTSVGMKNCINKLKPALMIPGHIHELWHDADSRAVYKWSYFIDNGSLPSSIQVMAWGEVLDFTR